MRATIKKWFNLNFYVSPLDRFLREFRQRHPRLSASQRAEKEKYAQLDQQRDVAETKTPKRSFWDNF